VAVAKTRQVKPLDLARTRAALAEFDRVGDEFDADFCPENSERLDAARLRLANAFAEDTADRNDRAVVRDFVLCMRGLTFVRRLCASPI